MREYFHTPVLVKEVIEYLQCPRGEIFVDATVGEGGHALEILRASQQSRVIGIDWDEEILERANKRLAAYSERVTLIHDDFVRLPRILHSLELRKPDGFLFDLGVSTFHLQVARRGFGFQHDSTLDMRMDKRRELTAYNIVNHFPLKAIEDMLMRYGEERWARRIAKTIGEKRQQGDIRTTRELAEIVSRAIPRRYHPRRVHPATKTFLALRISVNEELKKINEALKEVPSLLNSGGRICVISFHSLEDRIVKQSFNRMESTCICPPNLPQCVCGGREKVLQIITRRPLTPRPEELRDNPRSRSAKLRVAEKV